MRELFISFRDLSAQVANILKENQDTITEIHDRDVEPHLDLSPRDQSEQDVRTLLNIIKEIEKQFDKTGWMSRDNPIV